MTSKIATKTALVTGANKGMGFEIAQSLAKRQYKVIMADKNDQTQSKERILNSSCNNNIITEYLNLASFTSTRCFAEKIKSSEDRLDVLINNAGVFCMDQKQTEDCLDGMMQTNYLSPFLLTHLLLNLLITTPKSRIVFVTSSGSFFHNMTVEKLTKPNYFPPHYISGAIHYYNSKLCDMIASKLFAQKLKGCDTTSNSVHPGMANTDFIVKNANCVKKSLTQQVLKYTTKNVKDAADCTVFLATSKTLDTISGKYFADYQVRREPQVLEDLKFCCDIWTESLKIVNFCDGK